MNEDFREDLKKACEVMQKFIRCLNVFSCKIPCKLRKIRCIAESVKIICYSRKKLLNLRRLHVIGASALVQSISTKSKRDRTGRDCAVDSSCSCDKGRDSPAFFCQQLYSFVIFLYRRCRQHHSGHFYQLRRHTVPLPCFLSSSRQDYVPLCYHSVLLCSNSDNLLYVRFP